MIVVDAERCSGCRRCETSCSFFHSGRVGRSRARIQVVKVEETGIDLPVLCCQCRERYCLKCPESALAVGPQGQITASPTLCTGCGLCEKLCPLGAIEVRDEIPRVCDLCGGAPRCVEACTLGAIRFEPQCSEAVSLKEARRASKGLKPEEKRLRHAIEETRSLRRRWHQERSG